MHSAFLKIFITFDCFQSDFGHFLFTPILQVSTRDETQTTFEDGEDTRQASNGKYSLARGYFSVQKIVNCKISFN